MRILAIMGGGDWVDASVSHIAVPDTVNLESQKLAYMEWRHSYRASNKQRYFSFSDWLIEHGCRETTDDEVLEVWDDDL